jgi:anti-anti-sigma regulatory factor
MSFLIAHEQGRQILRLEGTVTIQNAQILATSLEEGLVDQSSFGVDTGGVEHIDTCVLQLLCSLRKTVPALSFDNPSDAFLDTVARCGLRRELLNGHEDP